MSEDKVEMPDAQPVSPEGDAQAAAEEQKLQPKRPRTKRWIAIGVIAAVIAGAGAGFWVWHEQPSFCGAICHTPMDPYLATYEGSSGEPGVDKWGNVVPDAGSMLSVSHKDLDGSTCLSCHVPTLQEQVDEGLHWVAGNYLYPLEERSMTDLNKYGQNEVPDQFCLNESCHNLTRDDLARATSSMERNPHVVEAGHAQLQCSECHKAHRQPVNACSRCHDDTDIPEGWLSAYEAAQLT